MDNPPNTLTDVPLILLIAISMAGLVGELRQADMPGVTTGEIIKRVALRFGSSAMSGMVALMLAMHAWGDINLAGAVGIATGLLGADAANAVYSRWVARKVGADGQAQ